jgi:molybdenum cofactor cytidylyltransferase
VLAAGLSRRMGTPKQLLRLGDKTMLERTLENVRGSSVDETVLVLGAAADEIRYALALDGVRVVINQEFHAGMAASLRKGLSALSPSVQAAFIVLADQPFVRPSTLDHLIAVHQKIRPQIMIPLYRGFRGNPVLLDGAVFPEVMHLTGDIGCRAIFGAHTESIHKLEVDDVGVLIDIDSEEDWRKLSSLEGPAARVKKLAEIEVGNEVSSGRPELVIVGRDAVTRALAKLGRMMEFTVTVVDPLLSLDELPEADRLLHVLDFSRLGAADRYVVVASRGQFDEEAVEQAILTHSHYTALLSSQARADEILRTLQLRGLPLDRLTSVRAPAGLEIGAQSPAEIALSIMAEIVAARRKS